MTAIEQIRGVLLAKADALVRRAANDLAALIHPDFVYVNAAGRTFGKAGYIDYYCASGKIVFSEQQFSDLEIKQFPGFAVATLITRDRFVASGQMVTGIYQAFCVFAQLGDRWQWAGGQTKVADS